MALRLQVSSITTVYYLLACSQQVFAIHRPEWLSHIDASKLNEYRAIAEERHNEAIRSSLEQYDVTSPSTLTKEQLSEEQKFIDNLELNEYEVLAPGKLPDFDEELGTSAVFVTKTPLFSKDECKDVVDLAEKHFDEAEGEPPKLLSGQYYIQGFWIKDVEPVKDWFIEKCKSRIFPLLKKKFPSFVGSPEDLCVDSAYLFKYSPQPGLRTEIHTDSGCLSFTFSLNPKEDYEGGGTWVEGLHSDDNPDINETHTIEMDAGMCTFRPGGIRHCGNPVTKGYRYIIGGFVMNRKRPEHVRQLVNNCPQRDQPETIKAALECAIALNPESEVAYSLLAQNYEELGFDNKAREVNEDCLRFANPKCTSSAYYLGTTRYREGNYEEALRYMQICLDIDPSDGDSLSTMAQCYVKLGNEEKEKETHLKTISAPGVSNRVLGQAYCNLGILSREEEEGVEIAYFKKSLEAIPKSLPTLHSLSAAYASHSEWDKAITVLQQVVKDIVKTDEERLQYLTMLYQVVISKLREENTAKTQGEMMEQLSSAMGKANLDRLMALRGRAS